MSSILRKKIRDFKKDPLFYLALLAIIILSLFFRFSNYYNRVYTLSDNSIAVQVARFAADNFQVPIVGQFASAGPFFYGPWYYIILEIVSFVPLGFFTHWYFISFVYLLFIYLIYSVGKEIGSRWVGLIASLFAVISPAQTDFSFSVWSPTIIPLLSLLSLIFLLRFFKNQKPIDLFLLGLIVSLAFTIHFQSFLLSLTLPVALLTVKPAITNYLRLIPAIFLGIFIPMVPFLYFDLRFDWQNYQNMILYGLVEQYKIWVPNSWKIYLGGYWPETWAYIIGGKAAIGALLGLLSLFLFVWRMTQFKKYKPFYLVSFTFLLQFVIYRYFRGERFLYYSLFAHPAVLLLSAWTIVQITRAKKLAGILLLIALLTLTFDKTLLNLKDRGATIGEINALKKEIYTSYPSSRFDVYGCELNPNSISYPLALSMYLDGRNSTKGIKINVCEAGDTLSWINIDKDYEQYYQGKALNRSTEMVYKDTALWWQTNPPTKGEGDFWQFIRQNSPLVPSFLK